MAPSSKSSNASHVIAVNFNQTNKIAVVLERFFNVEHTDLNVSWSHYTFSHISPLAVLLVIVLLVIVFSCAFL